MDLSGSKYEGDRVNGRIEGKGRYDFANGNYYVGDFKDGTFHGHGILYFKNCGSFEADWSEGVALNGKYTFSDGLSYDAKDWDYCIGNDRRFYTERMAGIKPAGWSQITNDRNSTYFAGAADPVPNDSFDTGDGYYRPGDDAIYTYQGAFLRKPDKEESQWITAKCRKGTKA